MKRTLGYLESGVRRKESGGEVVEGLDFIRK